MRNIFIIALSVGLLILPTFLIVKLLGTRDQFHGIPIIACLYLAGVYYLLRWIGIPIIICGEKYRYHITITRHAPELAKFVNEEGEEFRYPNLPPGLNYWTFFWQGALGVLLGMSPLFIYLSILIFKVLFDLMR